MQRETQFCCLFMITKCKIILEVFEITQWAGLTHLVFFMICLFTNVEKFKLFLRLFNLKMNNKVNLSLFREQKKFRVKTSKQPIISEQANGWKILHKINLLKRFKELTDPNSLKINPRNAEANRVSEVVMRNTKLHSGNDINPKLQADETKAILLNIEPNIG